MALGWDEYFMGLATLAGTKSKDPSTKVGCVIVGPDKEVRATGFNGFPRGVADSAHRYGDREGKLLFMVHAEANAVAAAARVGVSLKGCRAFVTKHPCAQCAALLIQAGVEEVISPHYEDGSRWLLQGSVAAQMLSEAGVKCLAYGGNG